MKRILKPTKLTLEIVAVLNTASDSPEVAAAVDVDAEYRDLDFEYQLSNEQLSRYRDFVRSCLSIVKNFGFEIVDKYQSDISYSYYFQFQPNQYAGFEDSNLELDVKFRLSDHYQLSESSPDSDASTKREGVIFRSFVVEGVAHDDILSTLKAIKEICQDLKVGDYSKLL